MRGETSPGLHQPYDVVAVQPAKVHRGNDESEERTRAEIIETVGQNLTIVLGPAVAQCQLRLVKCEIIFGL